MIHTTEGEYQKFSKSKEKEEEEEEEEKISAKEKEQNNLLRNTHF